MPKEEPSSLFGFAPPPPPPPWHEASEDERRRHSKASYRSGHRAVEFNNEEAIDDERDVYMRTRVKVSCPHCRRTNAPLLSKKTALVRADWRWVGLDHKEPHEDWLCVCPGCGEDYALTTYTPQ